MRIPVKRISAAQTPQKISIDGCSIHHVDVGPRDAPPLVLVHGITATHRDWRDNIDHFARRFRVLALDLPGFGRSDKPDAPYSMRYFVHMLARFLDEKSVRRAHIVGSSMGGQIAMHYTLTHPRRVDRLVLVDPAGVSQVPHRLMRMILDRATVAMRARRNGDPLFPRLPMPLIRLIFDVIFPGFPHIASRYARAYRAAIHSPDFALHFRAGFRSAQGVLGGPLGRRVRHIGAPTLIVWGARDRLLPVTAARPLRRAIPHARLLIYSRSGHCPMVDQPERWNRDVEQFLLGEIIGR